MFLRLGWVVGQAGLGMGTLIIILANVVTTITAISLCAIATNGEVKGGGAYYLISRALGPQFGGVIGVLFYVAQSVAVSLYVIGFAESVVSIYSDAEGEGSFTGDPINDIRVIGICTTAVLLVVALVGVGWYAKVQVILLAILIIAMLSIVIGAFVPSLPSESQNESAGFLGIGNIDVSDNLGQGYTTDLDTLETHSFFSVFAIFFPAVTGIMAGANLSGDLANPSYAIPKGTLAGIVVTFVTYVGLLWIVGSATTRCSGAACDGITIVQNGANITLPFNSDAWVSAINSKLQGAAVPEGGSVFNLIIMADISIWAPLVYAGVFAATLSSALASLVGAPRILQALAKDKLFNFKLLNWFAQLPEEEESAKNTSAQKNSHINRRDSVTAAPIPDFSQRKSSGAVGTSHALLSERLAVTGTTGAEAQAEDMDDIAARDVDGGDAPEPKRGYFLTFVVACGCVLIGRLDAIAPLISNFFMISYAVTNYAVFAASMSETPGWRPSFQYYNKYVSAAGAVLCIVVMFAFDWVTSLASVALGVALFKYLEYTDPPKHWGPAGDAARYINAVKALYKLRRIRADADGNTHVKTYRPAFMVLTDDPRSDDGKNLIMFVAKLYKGRGVSVIGQVLLEDAVPVEEDQFVAYANAQRRRNQKMLDRAIVTHADKKGEEGGEQPDDAPITAESLDTDGRGEYGVRGSQHKGPSGLAALALSDSQRQGLIGEVVVAPSLRRGSQLLLQLGGMGTLRANTLVQSFPEGWFLMPTEAQADRSADTVSRRSNKEELRVMLRNRIQGFESALKDALMAGMGVMVLRDGACCMNDGVVPLNTVTGNQVAARVNASGRPVPIPPALKDAPKRTVDVWWLADEGGLAVLLPHLMMQHPQFSNHRMRVFTVGTPDAADNDATLKAQDRSLKLASLMHKLRFDSDAISLKMDHASIRSSTVALFNTIYPGLLPEEFAGVQDSATHAVEGALPPGLRPEALAAAAASQDGGVSNPTAADTETADVPDPKAARAPLAASEKHPATCWTQCPEDLDTDVRRSLVREAKYQMRCSELVRGHSFDADVTFVVMPVPRSHYPAGLQAAFMELLSRDMGPVVLVRGSGAPVVTLSS